MYDALTQRSSLNAPVLQPSQRVRRWPTGSLILSIITILSLTALAWSALADIDRVTRAAGHLIASSRVQIIQASEGGVIKSLRVREGDRVEAHQVLAELDPARSRASLLESEARVAALTLAIDRLRAESSGADEWVPTDAAQA